MKKLTIVLEKGKGEWWGSLELPEWGLMTTAGQDTDEITQHIRNQLADAITEGDLKEHPDWKGIDAQTVEFEYGYDLYSFFEKFKALKMNELAKMAGINESLMNQYKSGVKSPSKKQVEKIQAAAQQLAAELAQTVLV